MPVEPRGGTPGLVPGGMLLHIGVHKTGTTAIQAALANSRPLLGQWQVRYPGRHQAHRRVASSVMDRPLGWRTDGRQRPEDGLWASFVKEAAAYDGVTVLSSEFLAAASTQVATRIVSDVGADRAHVVVTLRSLGRLLPSAWQQILKSGYETGYTDWLTRILSTSEDTPAPETFWNRHRHDQVVERWAALVGPDHVTVVVVDDTRRDRIYGDFESLLGLPAGTLLDNRDRVTNRSMTVPEAEFLRRVNIAVGGAQGWRPYSHAAHDALIKGMVEGRTPPADEPRLETPQWALDRAAALGGAMVDRIEATGVRIVGDLSILREHLVGPPAIDHASLPGIPIDAAVAAVIGALGPSQARPPAAPPSTSRVLRRLRAR